MRFEATRRMLLFSWSAMMSIGTDQTSTTNNPRVSEEAKQHAREMIDALGGDQPRAEMKQFDREKDQTRVAGGLKAYGFCRLGR